MNFFICEGRFYQIGFAVNNENEKIFLAGTNFY